MNVPSSTAKKFDYVNIAFLSTTPLIAIFGTGWYAWHYGVSWLEIAIFFAMYLLTGIAITGGYHRYYSHRSYECGKALQLFYLIFGAAAAENSILKWGSDHRYHHRYVDKEGDPYNAQKGGLYAHIGWILHKDTRDPSARFKNTPDLSKDPLVLWQNRWYIFLLITVGFLLPTLVGALQGRPLGGLLWGGFLRVVVVQHATFFINSLAHICGTKPYSVENSSRDSWWLGMLTFGEGYHNFHHKFQADYRNGIRWYQFDLTKWWIMSMRLFGLASCLRRTREPLILKAKLEVEMLRLEEKVATSGAFAQFWEKANHRLESGRRRLETALAQYQDAKIEYLRQKHEWSKEMRRQWKEKMDYYRSEFISAKRSWSELIRATSRIPHPSA